MRGGHFLKSWASTQKNITLSSGEAELVAAVKASTEAIGICQLSKDWGYDVEGNIHVDSTAALGMVNRKGCGKMRHVKVGSLWIQEAADTGELKYKKVLGTSNPADLMTKYLAEKDIEKYMNIINQEYRKGRAETALDVS